jgi:hypothetical protein
MLNLGEIWAVSVPLTDPIDHALALLKRQVALEADLRQPGRIRVAEERELCAVREQLQRYPQAVAAILQTASNLRRPVDSLRPQDVRNWV